MEDQQIIDLFWNRKETAVSETDAKYGKLCLSIARNIIASPEDCEECVNDTYFSVWNAIPTQRPRYFSSFLCRITRNLALKKWEYLSAAKRNSYAVSSLEELQECVSGEETAGSVTEQLWIRDVLNAFLGRLDQERRNVFLWRYWYFLSVEEIARKTGSSQSRIKSMLYHLRRDLRSKFEREGIVL